MKAELVSAFHSAVLHLFLPHFRFFFSANRVRQGKALPCVFQGAQNDEKIYDDVESELDRLFAKLELTQGYELEGTR